MRATVKVKLKPFIVPNYVSMEMPIRPKQMGMVEEPKYAIEELDADTLSLLCDEFRANVFARGNKIDHRLCSSVVN
jgi:hypothetical protein